MLKSLRDYFWNHFLGFPRDEDPATLGEEEETRIKDLQEREWVHKDADNLQNLYEKFQEELDEKELEKISNEIIEELNKDKP